MPVFGWKGDDDDRDDGRKQQQQHTPASLPPPDEDTAELERLLAQAKVGMHEYATPAAAVQLRSPLSRQQPKEQFFFTPAPEGDFNVPGSPDLYNIPEPVKSPKWSPPGSVTKNQSDGNENRDKIAPLPESDDDESSTEKEGIVNIEDIDTASEDNIIEEKAVVAVPKTDNTGAITTIKDDDKKSTLSGDKTLTVFQKSRKWNFHMEKTEVPVQLKDLTDSSHRRRREFQTRIHNLHCKIAMLTAKIANERIERDIQMKSIVEDSVYGPLRTAFDKISLQRDLETYGNNTRKSSLTQQWITLEKRLSTLDAHITHAIHVQLYDAKRPIHIHDEIENVIIPELNEMKNSKYEISFARKWEDLAGTMARRYNDNSSTRIGDIEELNVKIKKSIDESKHSEELIEQIADIRKKLEQARKERIENDILIRQYMQQKTNALKRAILEAYP